MEFKVFVDGQEGTTGLKINERLAGRKDIKMLEIDPVKRKDSDERKKYINQADIVFLCLPDAAAKEAMTLLENPATKVIDASTAHRTNPDWAYGLPELSRSRREALTASHCTSVPGCYATGFNVLLYPLVASGILDRNYPVTCHAVSGYSGGGKKMIEKYEGLDSDKKAIESPCLYSLALNHKHLPEMQNTCGLINAPIFSPIVSTYYQGMTVAIPIYNDLLAKKHTPEELQVFFKEYYKDEYFINVIPFDSAAFLENGYLFATGCNHTNRLDLFVFGNSSQTLLVARLDNLGKGASGAAVQCMNIMLGINEAEGLLR